MSRPIVLLTDFGQSDPFVGVMKGVICSRSPSARIIDMTHQVPPQDVRLSAFYLMGSFSYFPENSIFVCVVDPGVGSGRRIVWAKTKSYQFLAPDNGLLSWVERVEPFKEIREVSNRKLFLKNVSSTFHGRDIFAPVAAALALGASASSLGPKINSIKRISFSEPRRSEGKISGEILAIDRFGNAVTNIPPQMAGTGTFRFKGRELGLVLKNYACAEPGQAVAVIGSFQFVELAVRNGSFSASFGAKAGDAVELITPS